MKTPQFVLRRDTLKLMLLPASHWLIACAGGDQPGGPAADGGGAGAAGTPSAGGAGASAAAGRAGTAAIGGSPSAAGAGAGTVASPAGSGGAGVVAVSGGSGGLGGAGGSAGAAAGSGGIATVAGSSGAAAGSGGAAAIGGMAGSTAAVDWATGGTKTMQGGYPDPFMSSTSTALCRLYPRQTLGPCYADSPMMREDISDGMTGLPLRVSFLVTKSDGCTPVPDATVDIWHSGSKGVYSAFATGTICNPGTENVRSQMFCRGVQVTNAQGRCDFSTIFPGWYTGRTIHIHFTVSVGGRASVTSQLYFEDDLTDEILAQGEYQARGERDTTNASDMTFRSGGATPEQILFATAKRADGVLHAWKVLSIG